MTTLGSDDNEGMGYDGSPPMRWYDTDPALSKALKQLRVAPDRYHAQVALNIIKIIIEHQAEENPSVRGVQQEQDGFDDPIQATVQQYSVRAAEQELLRRRWYDLNETLHAAMQLLHDCPDDIQQQVIPTVSRMIESTLSLDV